MSQEFQHFFGKSRSHFHIRQMRRVQLDVLRAGNPLRQIVSFFRRRDFVLGSGDHHRLHTDLCNITAKIGIANRRARCSITADWWMWTGHDARDNNRAADDYCEQGST